MLVAVLGVSACGGGDDGGGAGNGARLSNAELVEQANRICGEYDRRIEDIQAQYRGRITGLGDEESLDAIAEFAGESRSAVADGLEELRALQPPEELESRYDRWLTTGEQTLERIDELEQAAAAGDREEVAKLVARADEQERESDRLAKELGLTGCAGG